MPPRKNALKEKTAEERPAAPASPSLSAVADLEKRIEEQSELIAELKREVHKVSRRLLWFQISGWIKLFIILAPFVVGAVYLMPYLEEFMGVYKSFFNDVLPLLDASSAQGNELSVDQLLKQFMETSR